MNRDRWTRGPRACAFFWRHAKGYLALQILLGALGAVPPIATSVIMARYIINTVVKGEALHRIFWAVAVYAALVTAFGLLGHLLRRRVLPSLYEGVKQRLSHALFEKSRRADAARFDSPAFLDELTLSLRTADTRMEQIATGIRDTAGALVSLVTLAAVLWDVDGWLLAFVSLSFALSFALSRARTRLQVQKTEETAGAARRKESLERCFYLPERAKELRMSPVQGLLLEAYENNAVEMARRIGQRNRKLWKLGFLTDFFSMDVLIKFGCLMYLGYLFVYAGTVRAGDFVGAFSAVDMLIANLSLLFSLYLIQIREGMAYLGKLQDFLSTPAAVPDGEEIFDRLRVPALCFDNVSFTYPGAGKPVFRGLSFCIRPGEKVAFVGYNGAGKTTLLKLLLRLYDADGGAILADGRDIRRFTKESYRRGFGVLLQNFQIFSATVGENVAADTCCDAARARRALREAGLEEAFGQKDIGLGTLLLREFSNEGAVLSGGQMQKLAIARVLYADCPVHIFDEATSALDGAAERAFHSALLAMSRDKTAILISHRLSVARMVDRIYFLENGEIVESGSHEELLALGGKYRRMWDIQAGQYQ